MTLREQIRDRSRGKLGTHEGVQYPSSFSSLRILGQLLTPFSLLARKWTALETMTSLEALVGVVDLMR